MNLPTLLKFPVMLILTVILALVTVTRCADVVSQRYSPDLSNCIVAEIEFLQPTECINLEEDGLTVRHGGFCHVEGSANNVEREILRVGVLTCDHGHWSGTRSSVENIPHRQKRLWGLIVAAVAGAALGAVSCYFLCPRGGTITQVITKYPPKFSDPCKPFNVEGNYNVAAGETSIIVSWSVPTASDQDGGTPSVVQVGGGVNGGSFEGSVGGRTHYITYQATDSDGLTGHCYFYFTVTILTCVSLPWPKNGARTCDNNNILGSSCQYTCDAGYQLKGSNTVTCQNQASPTWSTVPTCEKIICVAPLSPQNGALECTDPNYEYQSICTVRCNMGFGLQGPPYIQCRADRTWSNAGSATCEDNTPPIITCITPQDFNADRGKTSTSVTWQLPTALDGTDPNPTITQTEGPDPGAVLDVGSTVVKYKAKDDRGNESPECSIELRVEEITCGHPLDTIVDQYMRFNCSRYVYGTECTLSCIANLPLEGTDLITCEKTELSKGVWVWGTGSKPYCREISCPELEPPINGALVYDKVLTRPVYTMLCNKGFDIAEIDPNFSGFFTCTDSGVWIPLNDVPDCIYPRNVRFLKLPSEIFYYSGSCGTETALADIKDKFNTILNTDLNPYFASVCPANEICRAENVVITCGPIQKRKKRSLPWSYVSGSTTRSVGEKQGTNTRAKRQSETHVLVLKFYITVEIKLENQTLQAAVEKYDNIQLNILKPAVQDLVDNGTFDVTGYNLRSDSFQTHDYGDFACDPGYVFDRTTCKPCPLGYLLNETSSKCEKCPLGTYKSQEELATCTSCPAGYYTKKIGSKSQNECVKLCGPGSYSPDTMESCSACLRGYYQDQHGQTSCKRCPSETTTTSANSTAETDCQYFDVLTEDTDGEITISTFNRSLDDISLMFWSKRLDDRDARTVLRLTSNGENRVVFYLSDEIRLQINSQTDTVVGSLHSSTWSHVAVVWAISDSTVTVYLNGEQVHTKNIGTSPSPLVRHGGSFIVSSTGLTGVYLTGLHLLGTPLVSSDIMSHSSSCHVLLENDQLDMSAFEERTEKGIFVVKSSSCDAVNECRDSPCNGHLCSNGQDSYKCTCLGGWSGDTCSVPPDYCVAHQCVNGATCNSGFFNYSCTCLPGYSGSFCEVAPVNGGWSAWSEWSPCTKTCGSGIQNRARACSSPSPGLHGIQCVGDAIEQLFCNNQDCPKCKEFQRKYGTLSNCTTDSDTGSQTCTLYCEKDKLVPPGIRAFNEFTCGPKTNYVWDPMESTLPCVGPSSPRHIELVTQIQYNDNIPSKTQSLVSNDIQSNLHSTACQAAQGCHVTLDIAGSSRRKRNAGTTVTVTFSISLSLGPNLQYDLYISNGTVSPALQELIDAITTLELTAQYINNYTAAVFDVTTTDKTYMVDVSSLTFQPNVACDNGQAEWDGVCYECPSGTYLVNGQCSLCDRGSYQSSAGQSSCISCPNGLTTPTIGSTDATQCSELSATAVTSSTSGPAVYPDHPLDSSKVTIAVSLSVVAVVVAVIAIVIVVWCKKFRPRTKHAGSVTDMGIPSNTRCPRSYVRETTFESRCTPISQSDVDVKDFTFRSDNAAPPTHFATRQPSMAFANDGYLTPRETARYPPSPPPPYLPPILPMYIVKDDHLHKEIDRNSSVYDSIPDHFSDHFSDSFKPKFKS